VAVQDEAALIGRLLDWTSRRLAQMPDTALKRELRLVVDRYRRALADWMKQPPTPVQRTVLLDCVKALHDRVASRSTKDASS
jgi:hypothetical protein